LQIEARERKHRKLDKIDHYLGCGGELADKLATDKEIIQFVSEHVGCVVPTGIASYLYYDFQGGGIKPHVDTEIFSVNLMIKHEISNDKDKSSTVFFPPNLPPQVYKLQVGEVLLSHGSSTIHTRTIISEGEDIYLLTIGFNRFIEAKNVFRKRYRKLLLLAII
jgi:hypothetical protein